MFSCLHSPVSKLTVGAEHCLNTIIVMGVQVGGETALDVSERILDNSTFIPFLYIYITPSHYHHPHYHLSSSPSPQDEKLHLIFEFGCFTCEFHIICDPHENSISGDKVKIWYICDQKSHISYLKSMCDLGIRKLSRVINLTSDLIHVWS